MSEKKHRCCFNHELFKDGTYKGDGTEQCWMTEYLVNYGTEDSPFYFCQFHRDKAKDEAGMLLQPSPNQPDCRDFKSGDCLKELLIAWNDGNESRQPNSYLSFSLPGISCLRVELDGFEFSGPVIFDDSVFESATFEKTIFRNKASFKHVKFSDFNSLPTRFCSAQFKAESSFECAEFGYADAVFTAAIFSGEASFSEVQFYKNAYFNDAQFKSDTKFENRPEFKGETSFANTKFHSLINFGSPIFNKSPNFCKAEFSGRLYIWNAIFKEGAVFDDAHFDRYVHIFGGTRFCETVGFVNASFNDEVCFGKEGNFGDGSNETNNDGSDDEIIFEKGAAFYKATFNDVSFNKAIFSSPPDTPGYGAEFNFIKVKRTAFFTDCDFELINLNNLQVGSRINFLRGKITRLNFDSSIRGILTFDQCTIENATFRGKECSNIVFRDININANNIDFLGVNVYDTHFYYCTWESEGSRYWKHKGHDSALNFGKEKEHELQKFEDLYGQLSNNLEKERKYKLAGEFHYREMEIRSQLLKLKRGRCWDRFVLWIYGSVADYGENWQKLFIALIISFFLMAFLITCVEIWYFKNGLSVTLFFTEYRFYLKTVFLGIIPSGFQREILSEASLSVFSQFLIALQAIISLTLTTLFVMATRRQFRR